MKERRHLAAGQEHEYGSHEVPTVGRSTLAERHAVAYAAPPPKPMFEDDVPWEDLSEPALPEAHDDARQLSATTPPVPAPPLDDPAAKQIIYGDHHTNPHAKEFRKRQRNAHRHRPRRGKYNQPDVVSDKTTRQVAGRPGVVVDKDGTFTLKDAKATRYVFIKHGNQNIAQPFDVIEKAKLGDYNFRAGGKKSDPQGHTQRVLLNPSQPRVLVIGGKQELCVLTWVDGKTAAWLPVAALEGNTSKILGAIRARAGRWNPGRVSNDPQKLAKKSKRYVIRNDHVGRATPSDDRDVLAAGKSNGNNVTHYLQKDIRKPAFGADGQALGGGANNVTRSVVSICMNLPAGRTPPVAIDTAQAGESFFVMRDKAFHQQVPVFENKKRTSNVLHFWVFGHLGMYDDKGNLVPDPSRRGWVPLRVLADAAHLTTTTR